MLVERLPTDVEFAGELSLGLAGRCPQPQGSTCLSDKASLRPRYAQSLISSRYRATALVLLVCCSASQPPVFSGDYESCADAVIDLPMKTVKIDALVITEIIMPSVLKEAPLEPRIFYGRRSTYFSDTCLPMNCIPLDKELTLSEFL